MRVVAVNQSELLACEACNSIYVNYGAITLKVNCTVSVDTATLVEVVGADVFYVLAYLDVDKLLESA